MQKQTQLRWESGRVDEAGEIYPYEPCELGRDRGRVVTPSVPLDCDLVILVLVLSTIAAGTLLRCGNRRRIRQVVII